MINLGAFCTVMHNYNLLQSAEKTINAFINSKDTRIWFEDEKGQRFVPHGKIHIGSIELTTAITEEET